MTTKMLQVGDIVRINEPTKQDIEDMEFEGCGYTFKDQIGKLAVVTRVECAEHTVVRLVMCTEDYAPRLDNEIPIETVPAQVTLVHGSLLRACRISDAASAPLGGVQLPCAGDTIVGPASDEQTPAGRIRTPYNVKGLCITAHHIIVELLKNNERIVCIRFIPFKCLDTTSSPFTTF